MRRLAALADESFDLIVHPVSNVFVPEVRPVWAEAYRVLRPGGTLLAGFNNPVAYLFDGAAASAATWSCAMALPYSDLDSPPRAARWPSTPGRWNGATASPTRSAGSSTPALCSPACTKTATAATRWPRIWGPIWPREPLKDKG